MGKHWTVDHVTNGIDAFYIGLPIAADFDLTTVRHFNTQFGKPKTVSERFAPSGEQNYICIQHMFAVVLAQFIMHFGLGFGCFSLLNRSAHDEVQTLFLKRALEYFLYFCVHSGRNSVQEFDNCHFGS